MKASNYTKIWQTVQAIPPGKVASYGQIADFAGLPGRARLVGKALGMVPDDMQLPWYRVLRANGQIAFPSGSKGAEEQKGKLQEEGVVVLNNRVRLQDFGWRPDLAELLFTLKF
ncbi:MGMT family protein [Aliiglaciecola sp. CAU 1673]|uniref:MGMT family protein n=1 Tax=Aliiglaciecola sp. CAU 1673 TaxID=3032595 RepID=UPI0023D9A02C|nr:MGMT family protein [Aliiglaciecola sp. CAU 1673]MDF2179702.1 MGMT family protein [Aliiglaciecola sp. CAU 1673]